MPSPPEGARIVDCVIQGRGGSDVVEIISLPGWTRLVIFVLVIIPRVGVCLMLGALGCQWLTATMSFTNLILNALALEFIIQIDENIIDCFLPSRIKKRLGKTKFAHPILHNHNFGQQQQEVWEDYRRNILYFILCFLMTIAWVFYFQQVLPYEVLDIEEHCGAWYDNRFFPKCEIFERDCFPYGNVTAPHDYSKMLPS